MRLLAGLRGLPAWVVIPVVAALAMLPELLWGLSASDSLRYNLLWTDEFTRQFAGGRLYPRWLTGSWDGLGAPTFYHYPPLFFWVAAIIRAPFGSTLGPGATASLASLLFLALSAWTMRLWLLRHVGRAAALLGGIAYMLAPFHLYDIYARGSLAEAAAIAVLPLVPLGIEKIGAQERGGILLLAVGYALLILAHIPSALLASLVLVPAMLVRGLATHGIAFLVRCALGLAIGLGLTAIYLLPALQLLPWTLTSAWGGRWFEPVNWAFWTPDRWPSPGRGLLHLLFAASALLVTVAAYIGRRSDDRGKLRFWTAVGVVVFLLSAGFPPLLWQVPILAQVQFPARLTPQAEFIAITALIIGRPPLRNLASMLALLCVTIGVAVMIRLAFDRTRRGAATYASEQAAVFGERRDAPTFLPAGAPLPMPVDGKDGANPDLVELPPRGWLVRSDRGSVNAVERGGMVEIAVANAAPAQLVARRYYYPVWQVRDGEGRAVPVFSDSRSRLVAWASPPGKHRYTLALGAAPGERVAGLVSLFTAVLLLLGLAWHWWSRDWRSRNRNPAAIAS